jgi:hypothetical protein
MVRKSGIPERGFRSRECRGRLRGSNALPFQLGHASAFFARRKERESNPQGFEAHPFSRRGTAPVAVLPEWLRQASNLHRPG